MNNAQRQKRVLALRTRVGIQCATLHMEDGSTGVIRSDQRHWGKLHAAWCERVRAEADGGPEPVGPLSGELDSIRDACSIDEEDGELFNLLSILLKGPTDEQQEAE